MFKCAMLNFRKWGSCYRIYIVIASVLVFTYIRTDSIREYAKNIGMAVTPYFFPFQFSDGTTSMLFYFALVLLLCNAPFTDNQQMFVMLRTGRRKWFAGQILYVFLANICFFLLVAIASIVLFFPWVGISASWGSIFTVMAENPQLSGIFMDSLVIYQYQPFIACGITFGMNILVGTLYGLVIFYGNMFGSRVFGPAVAVSWIVLSNIIEITGMHELYYISPLNWGNPDIFIGTETDVTYTYAIIFLLSGILLLSALILRKSKRYTIEALEEI